MSPEIVLAEEARMLRINDQEPQTLFDVTCRIYDANMMLRAIAELDLFQHRGIPCWYESPLGSRWADWIPEYAD